MAYKITKSDLKKLNATDGSWEVDETEQHVGNCRTVELIMSAQHKDALYHSDVGHE